MTVGLAFAVLGSIILNFGIIGLVACRLARRSNNPFFARLLKYSVWATPSAVTFVFGWFIFFDTICPCDSLEKSAYSMLPISVTALSPTSVLFAAQAAGLYMILLVITAAVIERAPKR